MKLTRTMLLCCLTSAFYSRSVSGITDCDGLICPDNTYCSVSSTSVDGKQQTVRTCKNSQVARSFSTGDGMVGSHQGNVVHSSNFVMGGGGGSCIHHSSSVNGINTHTYSCNIGNGNSYYVTNTNGEYKNCTSVPVTLDSGVTTMKENCVPMSAEDIQRVKQMEEEMQRRAAEVQQRMAGMAMEMQARNQEMQNRMMYNMENMKHNMHNTFEESMRRAKHMQEKMLQMAEDMKQRTFNTIAQAEAQGQAAFQHAIEDGENMRKNLQGTFSYVF